MYIYKYKMYKINTSKQNTIDTKCETKKRNTTKTTNNTILNNTINEDIHKMYLLPPHCPMTPKTYTDFFNDNDTDSDSILHHSNPYKNETVKHPREGYKHTIESRNFYSDFKKDALEYTSKNFEFINNSYKNQNQNQNQNQNHTNNNTNENIKLYEETKPHKQFAKPMAINGSNKVSDLFDNCMNKKTFEYTKYSTISPHHKQWIDNPIFTKDISQETQLLKNNYMDSRETEHMNLYNGIIEDMNAMTYNQIEYTSSALVKKIEDKLNNKNVNNSETKLEDDNIKKMKKNKSILLNNLLEERENLRKM